MTSFSRPFLTLVPDADAAPAEQFFATAWEDTRGWDTVPGWAPTSPVETPAWSEPSWSEKPSWDDTPTSPEAWRADALCAETDPEAFFPEKGGSTRDAKRVCAGCPVRAECLEFALASDERFGIWGGLSERERRRLRQRRAGSISA
jgi:WhiB family redox-sensing transcriptional regulator